MQDIAHVVISCTVTGQLTSWRCVVAWCWQSRFGNLRSHSARRSSSRCFLNGLLLACRGSSRVPDDGDLWHRACVSNACVTTEKLTAFRERNARRCQTCSSIAIGYSKLHLNSTSKGVPVSNYARYYEGIWRSGDIPPRILNLDEDEWPGWPGRLTPAGRAADTNYVRGRVGSIAGFDLWKIQKFPASAGKLTMIPRANWANPAPHLNTKQVTWKLPLHAMNAQGVPAYKRIQYFLKFVISHKKKYNSDRSINSKSSGINGTSTTNHGEHVHRS